MPTPRRNPNHSSAGGGFGRPITARIHQAVGESGRNETTVPGSECELPRPWSVSCWRRRSCRTHAARLGAPNGPERW